MGISQDDIFDLIGRLYETATQASADGWNKVFGELSELMSSGPGSLHFYIRRSQTFSLIANSNPPGFAEDFNSHYFHILPFRDVLTTLRPGEVFDRTREFPDDLFVPTELYQEYFKKIGIYHVLHANLIESNGVSAGITFTRPENMREFEQFELDAFQMVLPHLQRAMNMHIRMLEADGRGRVMEEAWDRIPQGVVITSESGVVHFRNRAADSFIGKGKPLDLDMSGRIVAATAEENTNLHALIKGVFDPDPASPSSYGGTLRINGGDITLAALVTPFTNSYGTSGLFERLAMILIADPSAATYGTLEADLTRVYGLTPSEAKIAMTLADGFSIEETAKLLGITVSTARTHLKRIYAKTNTNRQGALVKLILTTPRVYKP